MKAILYADWVGLRGTSLRPMLATMCFFLMWSVMLGEPLFFGYMMVISGFLYPNSAFAGAASAGWDRLSLTMPILRREVVASRFVMALLVNAALFVVGVSVGAVCYFVTGRADEIWTLLTGTLAAECTALLMIGLQLAAAFKWGIERAALVVVGTAVALIAGIAAVARAMGTELSVVLDRLGALNHVQGLLFMLGLLAVSLAVYGVCWLVSVRVFAKKEF